MTPAPKPEAVAAMVASAESLREKFTAPTEGGRKMACSGEDPIVDKLSETKTYGMWEKYQPYDLIPKFIPDAFDEYVLNPLANVMLADPKRDTLILRHIFQWTFINLPIAYYVLFHADASAPTIWLWGAFHAFMWFTAMDTYVLALHVVSHRKVFTPTTQTLMWPYFVHLMGPLFGETPETYYVHHIGMHHAYNNHFKDLSCTMRYKRDSFRHWLCYWAKFMTIHADLYSLFKNTNRKLLWKFFLGELSWFLIAAYSYSWRPANTLIVIILPVFVMRMGMMAGNWGQHAFINPDEPTSNWGHSVNIIDSAYNRRCFNDGYHIMHHQYPTAHWTELPQLFAKDVDEIGAHDCVVFRHPKWDFTAIWFYLMIKDYDTLAKHYVNLTDKHRTHEEIKAMLKARTQRVYHPSEFNADGEFIGAAHKPKAE